MSNHGRVSDQSKIVSDVLTVTSAAGDTCIPVDMAGCNQALFHVHAQGTFSTITLDLVEATASTATGSSAAGGSAGIVIGGPSTLIPVTGGVRSVILTLGTDATAGATWNMSVGGVTKSFVHTTSTALNTATAQTSTLLYYGSTIDSTADTGLQLAADALATALVSTNAFGSMMTASSGTTATLAISLTDDATGSIGLASTNSSVVSAVVTDAAGAFNIANDELSTGGNRYVKVKASTASTSVKLGVTVIRTGMRFQSSTYAGKLST